MRKALLLPLALLAAPALAGELEVGVQIPRLNVAEYHRPYVAIWLERPDQQHVADLAVWYDLKLKDDEGEKWLKDLRQWWRRSGRQLDMPVDGLSGATRAVGTHQLKFDSTRPPLAGLEPGDYRLVVEAAREVGGRELLRVPFSWPVDGPQSAQAQGETELGTVTLTLTP
ncbi:DUF2271 domain-containing protein [Stutzerimonas azotifigens]|uniref:DUF2271 domain-containing protein n=1 Tax=Stutzerimonas azotifigens TaxID=291995 RepID=UPI0003FB566E|nr:DUF2271 domain-containing protein [Stutzerimonas azotifigens]